jgi:Fe-S cluster assembly protein SufB
MMNNVAMDIVDSVSVATTFKKTLGEKELFYEYFEAIKEHPELVRKYLGTVIPKRQLLCSFEFAVF